LTPEELIKEAARLAKSAEMAGNREGVDVQTRLLVKAQTLALIAIAKQLEVTSHHLEYIVTAVGGAEIKIGELSEAIRSIEIKAGGF